MKTTRFILFMVLLSFTPAAFSQDLVVKKDSSKIFCKITREDSLSLYYISMKDTKGGERSIDKSSVLNYHSTSVIPKVSNAKAAGAGKIYKAASLTRGFYRSYFDYISNAPSVLADVAAVERSDAELMLTHGSLYAYSVKGSTVILGEYYGFCDGKNVFINYDHPRGYCKMEYLGPYTFFTYSVHGMGVLAAVPDQLTLIDETGNFMNATVKNIKKILKEKDPELYAKYEAEERPKEKRKEYLIQLNEYLVNKK